MNTTKCLGVGFGITLALTGACQAQFKGPPARMVPSKPAVPVYAVAPSTPRIVMAPDTRSSYVPPAVRQGPAKSGMPQFVRPVTGVCNYSGVIYPCRGPGLSEAQIRWAAAWKADHEAAAVGTGH